MVWIQANSGMQMFNGGGIPLLIIIDNPRKIERVEILRVGGQQFPRNRLSIGIVVLEHEKP